MRKNFPLRIDAELFDALKKWADDELRSANGQIEFLLRQSLKQAGRLPKVRPLTETPAGGTETLPDNPPANHPDESSSE